MKLVLVDDLPVARTVEQPTPITRLAIGIVLTFLGLGTAVLGSVGGMLYSFEQIETLPVPTPDDLAQGVHLSRLSLVVGFLVAACGIVLIVLHCMRSVRQRDQAVTDGPWS